MIYSPDLLTRAKQIQLLLLDVDGVLTDGTLIYSEDSKEAKAFNTQDGFGLRLIQDAGIATGVITARKSAIVARRTKELRMQFVYQEARNKLEAFDEIIEKSGLQPDNIAYMGDDWLDLKLLSRVGLAAAPANAVEEVKNATHFVTRRNGGRGAVRDLCNLLITAKGLYSRLLAQYSG